jgi:hypothetical protein
MLTCDYNGWADVPEEEREGIDAFEAAAAVSGVLRVLVLERSLTVASENEERRAA